jgi:DNA-binding NtrC family response regulator
VTVLPSPNQIKEAREMSLHARSMPQDPYFLEQLATTPPRRSRILLAEDDREMRSLVAWELRKDGHEVVEAENGIELLHHLEPAFVSEPGAELRREFDLVISDLRMPCFSAFAVLEPFRKHDPETPVILITAFGDEPTHAEARALGIATVIDKPFDLDDLRVEVKKHLAS